MTETRKSRYSRKRERICEWIHTREDHPSAEDVYHAMREEFPDLSLGTVYKNLHVLEDQGRISKVLTPLGTEHYDCRTDDHSHFICRCCGKIMDLEVSSDSVTCIPRELEDGGQIETLTVTAFGLCGDCRK